MAILFYRKTNKPKNNLYQVKSQIRLRAEYLRKQQLRNEVHPLYDLAENTQFAHMYRLNFIPSGRGEFHEHY